MTHYRLTVEYDGAAFSGWQIQPNVETVQGVLERAATTALRHPVRIQGAGRTDAGVHALGQTASFIDGTDLAPQRLQHSLTALCRPYVAVSELTPAPEGFNARFDAMGKHYQYRVWCRSTPSPLQRHTSVHVPVSLDIDRISRAAALFEGTHDFGGFRAADCGRIGTVRELFEVSIGTDGFPLVTIDVKGTAFLKNMVRIIAGTLIDVGRGRRSERDIERALETGDRTMAGPTAPAHGLTLMQVYYPDGWLRARSF